jgi:hypothetical protein
LAASPVMVQVGWVWAARIHVFLPVGLKGIKWEITKWISGSGGTQSEETFVLRLLNGAVHCACMLMVVIFARLACGTKRDTWDQPLKSSDIIG